MKNARPSSALMCALFVATLSLLLVIGCESEKQVAAPKPEVTVVEVAQRDVPMRREYVGQTKGSDEVEIRARVEGFLDGIHFREGTEVQQGQLLYTIDSRPFDAAVAQAEAQAATMQANLGRADQDVARLKPLAEQNAVPRRDYETALSTQAAVRAALDAARAQVVSSQLNRNYTRITAPSSGVIGLTKARIGDFVGRGAVTSITLNTISKVDPILVRFNVSEREYLELARILGTDRSSGPGKDLELILADGTVHPEKGRVLSLERAIDPTTGALLVEAQFPNSKRLIRPGQFARVALNIQTVVGALLVPQRCVTELQGIQQVYVVGPDNKVDIRAVRVGPRIGEMWVIESGLKPGEKVILDGLQKVRAGVEVVATPAAEVVEAKPAPAAS